MHRVLAIASQLGPRLAQPAVRLLQQRVVRADARAQRVPLVPLTPAEAVQFDLARGELGGW
jgi:hypothetical protein